MIEDTNRKLTLISVLLRYYYVYNKGSNLCKVIALLYKDDGIDIDDKNYLQETVDKLIVKNGYSHEWLAPKDDKGTRVALLRGEIVEIITLEETIRLLELLLTEFNYRNYIGLCACISVMYDTKVITKIEENFLSLFIGTYVYTEGTSTSWLFISGLREVRKNWLTQKIVEYKEQLNGK